MKSLKLPSKKQIYSSEGKQRGAHEFNVAMRRDGSSVIELAISVMLMGIMTVVAVDIAVLIFGLNIHDRCCREAARAASKASSSDAAVTMARAALASCKTDGTYLSQPEFDNNELIFVDFNGTPQPDQVPTVTLTTHAKVRLPATIGFANAALNIPDGKINSSVKYTFPLTSLQVTIPSESP